MRHIQTLSVDVDLVEKSCGECGMVFAVPDWFERDCHDNGREWTCPAGHSRVYATPRVKKLEKELDAAKAQKQALADQLAAAERERKRQERRSKAGACPCCNRTFVQLSRHMKAKHPDYAAP